VTEHVKPSPAAGASGERPVVLVVDDREEDLLANHPEGGAPVTVRLPVSAEPAPAPGAPRPESPEAASDGDPVG
jgi:hypothetical protein